MSEAKTDARDYGWRASPAITIYVLKENKRPVGFAPWPQVEPEPRKKKGKKKR